jgi:uncharacterized protein (DUF362 family)
VSIVKIKDDDVNYAVEKAIDLIGGIESVTKGKERIMLKPNLVADHPSITTNPFVVGALAALMKKAKKEVLCGEAAVAAQGIADTTNLTKDPAVLDALQQRVFDELGYSEGAKRLGIQLVNLHTGDLVKVKVSDAYTFDELFLHRTLTEIDMLCSVPMMKTHFQAGVTLGMKNLIGLYPGQIYSNLRLSVHRSAARNGSPGVAYEIVDMVRANRLGLVVVDGSTAMEGEGPSAGTLVKMDVIITGTNPLATDMVAAAVMGFEPLEIPTFVCANQMGMSPDKLSDIEIRGETIGAVQKFLQRPTIKPVPK